MGCYMATQRKIKLMDDDELRIMLDNRYESSSQIQLCQYALQLAKHVLDMVSFDIQNPIIQEGFSVNIAWQKGLARMHDVRQAGFRIHALAKAQADPQIKIALRVVGQAVASGHMREHAMVASDYAIKLINLKYPLDKEAVQKERRWQIQTMRKVSIRKDIEHENRDDTSNFTEGEKSNSRGYTPSCL